MQYIADTVATYVDLLWNSISITLALLFACLTMDLSLRWYLTRRELKNKLLYVKNKQ